MTDQQRPDAIDPETASTGEPAPPQDPASGTPVAATAPEPSRPPRASQGETPLYKGGPLDSERGPGLGCFWIQAIMLGVLLVLTPITVALAWPPLVSAGLLILTLVLLLFTGQTVIFLLRLVAADRRGRRTPRSPSARKTVGMIEDGSGAPDQGTGVTPDHAGPAPSTDPADTTDAAGPAATADAPTGPGDPS